MRQNQDSINHSAVQLLSRSVPSAVNATGGEPVIDAFCDVCQSQATALRRTLENEGWGLYQDCIFCPNHEAML